MKKIKHKRTHIHCNNQGSVFKKIIMQENNKE